MNRAMQKAAVGRRQTLRAREYVNSVKARGCQLCGYAKCMTAIEFHHVGTDKTFELSNAGSRSVSQLEREISKCVVVCANCHREIHSADIGFVNKDATVVEDKQNVLPFEALG